MPGDREDDGRRRGWRTTIRRAAAEDEELHYGEASRRQARALGLRGAPPEGGRFPDGGGRYGAAAHDPILGWYEPDATTGEIPIAEELRQLRESQAQAHVQARADGPGQAGSSVGLAEPAPPAPVVIPPPVEPADLVGGVAPPEAPAPPIGQPPPPGRRGRPGKAGERPSSGRSSMLVAAGIMLSRCAGLLREMLISRYLGTTAAADAFKAALRIPNTIQNLLGEGVLSASFIPVYARMRAEGDEEGARKLAGAICGLLLALTGVLVFVGVVFTRPVTAVLVTGYSGGRFDLTVKLVRIMFPAMGFMPISAWCLGVLNSHRKFFTSYVAPVLWNSGQIITLLVVALMGATDVQLATALAWGVFIGGIGEVGIQLPGVYKALGRHWRLSLSTRIPGVRSVLGRFGPVVMGRGVVQILGYVDLWLASFLAVGAVSALTYAQVLYLLPISIFGMSVAAAELPDLSEVTVDDPETRRAFRRRLEDGMARILFYVAPTTALFIVVGDVIVRVLFQRGAFGPDDTIAVWYVIAAFSLGLPATTASRLLQNALYAMDDARTPARLAALRVAIAGVVGLALMFPFDRLTVVDGVIHGWGDVFTLGPLSEFARNHTGGVPHLGIVGLALGAALSSWIEYRMLSTAVAWRIGRSRLGGRWMNPISAACIVGTVVAFGLVLVFGDLYSLIAAPLILGPAALAYMGVAYALGVPEAKAMFGRIMSLAGR